MQTVATGFWAFGAAGLFDRLEERAVGALRQHGVAAEVLSGAAMTGEIAITLLDYPQSLIREENRVELETVPPLFEASEKNYRVAPRWTWPSRVSSWNRTRTDQALMAAWSAMRRLL